MEREKLYKRFKELDDCLPRPRPSGHDPNLAQIEQERQRVLHLLGGADKEAIADQVRRRNEFAERFRRRPRAIRA